MILTGKNFTAFLPAPAQPDFRFHWESLNAWRLFQNPPDSAPEWKREFFSARDGFFADIHCLLPSFALKLPGGRTGISCPFLPEMSTAANGDLLLRPAEGKFSKAKLLVFQEEDGEGDAMPVKERGETRIAATDLKNSRSILLRQQDGDWVLFHRSRIAAGDFREQSLWMIQPWLSLKSILDAQSGLDRLIEALQTGSFRSPAAWRPHLPNLRKLLDIIRSASSEEEDKILEALAREDHALFSIVQSDIFSFALMPFLNARELQNILLKIPDAGILPGMRNDSPERAFLLPHLSRNRAASLSSSASGGAKDRPGEVWPLVEAAYRAEKEKIRFLPAGEITMQAAGDEREAETSADEGYWNTCREMRITGGENILFHLEEAARLVSLCLEIRGGDFYLIYLRHAPAGIYQLPALKMRRILTAAITYDNRLLENTALKKEFTGKPVGAGEH